MSLGKYSHSNKHIVSCAGHTWLTMGFGRRWTENSGSGSLRLVPASLFRSIMYTGSHSLFYAHLTSGIGIESGCYCSRGCGLTGRRVAYSTFCRILTKKFKECLQAHYLCAWRSGPGRRFRAWNPACFAFDQRRGSKVIRSQTPLAGQTWGRNTAVVIWDYQFVEEGVLDW